MTKAFTRELIQAIRDPALQGRWLAIVDGYTAPELVVESINPGLVQFSANQRNYGGRVLQFAGAAAAINYSMVLYETDDLRTLDFLQDWRRQVYNPDTGLYGLPVNYKKTVVVNMFPNTSSTRPAARFTLSKTWPVNFAAFDLSYANQEGRLVHNVEMAADEVEFKLL
jgi:hypothetical protein